MEKASVGGAHTSARINGQTMSDQISPLCNLSSIWSDNMTGHES